MKSEVYKGDRGILELKVNETRACGERHTYAGNLR
jgi:hypothetical protein